MEVAEEAPFANAILKFGRQIVHGCQFDQAVQAYVDKMGMERTNAFIEVQRDSQTPAPTAIKGPNSGSWDMPTKSSVASRGSSTTSAGAVCP